MSPNLDRAVLKASWESWVSSDSRPRAGPYWLQWLWTLLFGAAIAVPFTVIAVLGIAAARGTSPWEPAAWLAWYGRNLVVCLTVAAVIHLLFDLGRRWLATAERLARWQPWQRTLYFSGTPLVGVMLGWPLGLTLVGADLPDWIGQPRGTISIAGTVAFALMATFAFHHYFAARTRQIDAERRATEAQLKLLQAQIEPHFLFNTLANVEALIEPEPAKARRMLGAFSDYLRASLSTLRRDEVPLADELALAEAYLRVQGTRMEGRLAYTIEADDAARRATLPPLLLQPLVENAVLHGVEPRLDGGTVAITAQRAGGRLVLHVRDDGPGPAAAPSRRGAGVALDNIRERLRQRHGDAAALTLAAASPRGTVATIVLPLAPEAGR